MADRILSRNKNEELSYHAKLYVVILLLDLFSSTPAQLSSRSVRLSPSSKPYVSAAPNANASMVQSIKC